MANRYTITYDSKPAGQQVAAATLFYAAAPAQAQALLNYVLTNVLVAGGNYNALNYSLVTVPSTLQDITGTKEVRTNNLMSNGTLTFTRVPTVLDTKTENDVEAVLNVLTAAGILVPGQPQWTGQDNSTITTIVRYREVNEVHVGL